MPRSQQSTTISKSVQSGVSKPATSGSGSPSKFSFDWRKLLPSRVDRGTGANDKPKMSSGILRMLLGFLVFLVVARLIEIGLLWADASYHLGLEKYVTSQKNAFLIGGMTWFALLYFVAIIAVYVTLLRLNIVPRDPFGVKARAQQQNSRRGQTGAATSTRSQNRSNGKHASATLQDSKTVRKVERETRVVESRPNDAEYDQVKSMQRSRRRHGARR